MARHGAGLDVLVLNWRDSDHPEGGGSELYVEQVAAGLVARGHRVTLFCADHEQAPRDEQRDGYRIVRRGSRGTVYLRAALRGLRRGHGAPDVVVDVQNGLPFLARLWARSPVVVLVHHVHREQWGVVFGRVVATIGWFIESRIAPRVQRGCHYVAVSQVTRQELVELGVQRSAVTLVHNGTTRPVPVDGGRTPYPSLCVLGRLVPHKRVELALGALARLAPEHPGLRLSVVGHGWWDAKLREEAERLGVVDRVDFLGHVDERRKAEVLAQSWLLVVPSLKEGWGLVVVEAASHGTPAVAYTGAGGLAESIVDGVTGALVDGSEDPDPVLPLARTLDGLLRDADERARLGRAAEQHARRFTWEHAVDRFESVLNAAVHGTPIELRLPDARPDQGTCAGELVTSRGA